MDDQDSLWLKVKAVLALPALSAMASYYPLFTTEEKFIAVLLKQMIVLSVRGIENKSCLFIALRLL